MQMAQTRLCVSPLTSTCCPLTASFAFLEGASEGAHLRVIEARERSLPVVEAKAEGSWSSRGVDSKGRGMSTEGEKLQLTVVVLDVVSGLY